ncbi:MULTISPECIES: flagellar hook-associated protein FlgL [unclassified Fusibacter]|uniref:flagellar hook-associated protein FlgL n=1 Tax=unclassified Fusibacter TaxID=2624464 RepID=UPI0010118E1E|nr:MULTISPECIES: flagellar hook-associated protein FlgL [unclassified Fusibacter]MCK8059838.1 flagellar hook-associated protein FlgL [Fusibacter sp. A2]NPE21640.1 flagellar hook-associated protein FlgL [Fusibacter sp. A1]RXV62044.1 flagellar hook-associated protein 3 [Fusibacter sp. A1]
MMRVTNNMMVDQLRRNLILNQRSMYTKQDQLATGKRIQRASDDPILSSKILKFTSDISELNQYDRNTTDALAWLEVTESAVYDNVGLLQRARELAVQAANGTNTTEDRQKLSNEINGLKEQLITNGNANFAGRYVFSGYETDKKFFNPDGSFNIDVTQFTIDNPPVTKYEVGIGTSINISSNGLDIYGYKYIDDAFTQTSVEGSTEGVEAKQSILSGNFSLTEDYSVPVDELSLTIDNGVPRVFDIDESTLNGSIYPITKETVLKAYREASDGTVALSEIADIYYNINDELVVKMKEYGNVAMSTASTKFVPTVEAGADTIEASVTASTALTDAAIALDPGVFENREVIVTVNGSRQKITLFDAGVLPNTVDDVVTEMNAKFDAVFGPGKVVASGTDGVPIQITTSGVVAEGKVQTLTVETIRSTESELISDFNSVFDALQIGDDAGIQSFLGKVDEHLNNILSLQADIGARVNRLELITNRIAENNITYTRQLSDAQDADIGQVIMDLKNSENIYKSSLSVGARVIQPSLVDFLR